MTASRVLALALAAGSLTGCVERTLSITSEPTGALVTIGDHEVGRTPLETTFKFHGTYDVLVTLDGYEPLRTTAKAKAPLYEYPGPDVVAEVLPFTFRNNQDWHFVLEPRLEDTLSTAELESGMLSRAHELREQLAQTPPPAPPKRPWLEGESTDGADQPADEAPEESAPEATKQTEPPAQSTASSPPVPQAAPPARPMGRMTPVNPNN